MGGGGKALGAGPLKKEGGFGFCTELNIKIKRVPKADTQCLNLIYPCNVIQPDLGLSKENYCIYVHCTIFIKPVFISDKHIKDDIFLSQ